MAEHIFFNNVKYRQTPNGYWASTTRPRRMLHREIWKATHGEIPNGYEIHHVDFNPSNNALENLQCLTKAEHKNIHMDARRTIPKVCAYCGKEFLAIYDSAKFCSRTCKRYWLIKNGRMNLRIKKFCVVCGKEFETNKYNGGQYCSQKCVVAATKHLKEKLLPEQKAYVREVYKPRDKEFGGAALARKLGVSTSVIYRTVK